MCVYGREYSSDSVIASIPKPTKTKNAKFNESFP